MPHIDDVDFQKEAYTMLGLLQRIAPTGKEQRQIAEVYNQMRDDGLTWREVLVNLANILSNGLEHGNWPWTQSPLSDATKARV
jgi:hypothetical protein